MTRKALIAGWLTLAILLAGCSTQNPASGITGPFFHGCPAASYSRLDWSPDGQHIAFLSSIPPQPTHIYIMRPDGREVSRLIDQGGDIDLYGWSPDGRALAFGRGGGLFVASLDGTTRRIPIQGAFVTGASWSPDSQRLVYSETSYEDKYFVDLFIADSFGGDPVRLTHDPGADTNPDWSPDGSTIAFVRWEDNEQQIMLIDADGANPRRITRGPANHIAPYWSPDGSQLSYLEITNFSRIITASVDGSPVRDLWTIASGMPYRWMPDSQHFSYFSPVGYDLMVGDNHTHDEEAVRAAGLTLMGSFTWSPDGSQVAMVAGTRPEIIVIDRAHGTTLQVTDNPGKYTCFHWPF